MRASSNSAVRAAVLAVLLLASVFASVPSAHAAAPANDAFADAMALTAPASAHVALNDATVEPNEPLASCAYPQPTASVWFRVTGAPGTGFAASSAGSDFDNALAVWSGTALASLQQLSCDNSSSTYTSSRVRAVIPASGVAFIQAVGEWGETGNLRLTLSAVERPEHDAVGNARAITSLPFSEETDLDGATLDAGEADGACGMAWDEGTVWYRLDLPDATRIRIAADNTYELNVYSGAADALNMVKCGSSRTIFTTAPGTTYWIQLADSGNGGYYALSVESLVVPANDNFADAAALKINQRVRGSLENGSVEVNEPTCATQYSDSTSVWYKFSLPLNQLVKVRGQAYSMAIYAETPAGLTQLACTSKAPYLTAVASLAGLPVLARGGQTYYVQLAGFTSSYSNPYDITLLPSLGGI